MRSLVLLLSACVCSTLAQNSSTAQDALTFALTYGYPLLAFEKVKIAANVSGINRFLHFRQLQGPTSVAVVKPNVDTLYSAMVYDLSHDDVVVSIPDGIPASQFALISFFDPFGTNYASIGSGNEDEPGRYRLQPRTDNSTASVSPSDSSSSDYKALVNSPSIYGFILIRWLVNNTNLDALHTWQDATVNASIAVSQPRAPTLFSLPNQDRSLAPAVNVIRLLTAFAPYTLPSNQAEANRVLSTLAQAGISNGTYTAQQGIDLDSANSTAVSAAVSAASASDAVTTLSNGWTTANGSLIGTYGINYAFRSAVASGGYLAIVPPNAIYPSWSNGSSNTPLGGDFVLGANDAFIFTFSSTPPLISTGFWSLTAYQNNYLIANQYNIYAVTSERSNITYPDGSLVYSNNGSASANQSYQILVQASDIAPPSNWSSNFLPGPAGGGSIQITLRLYGAQQSLLNGDWQYPVVTRTSAIRGGSSNGTTGSNTTVNPSSTSSTPSSTSGPARYSSTGGANHMTMNIGTLSVAAAFAAMFGI